VRILFTGGRRLKVPAAEVRAIFLDLVEKYGKFEVIVGDAAGTDKAIRGLGYELGHNVRVFLAEWDKHGKSAGPRRNQAMISAEPDFCLAFPGGAGTANCTRLAIMAGVPVIDALHWRDGK